MRGDHIQIGLRLPDRDAGLESSHRSQKMRLTHFHLVTVKINGQPQVGALRQGDVFAHHAEDFRGFAIEDHRLIENSGIAAKTSLPEVVTEDRDLILARLLVIEREAASDCRGDFDGVEIIAGDEVGSESFRITVARQVCRERDRAGGSEVFERFVLIAVVEVVEW